MITNISDIRYLYRQYPDFVAACEQITQEALTTSKALTEQQNTMVSAAAQSHRDQGTPLPTLSELRRQHDEIWTMRNQRIDQARKDMGVPLLQNWDEALQPTGKAIYHDFYPDEASIRTATLTRTEDGSVVCEMHLTRTYSATSRYMAEGIGHHLPFGIDIRAWEAVDQEAEKKAKSSEFAVSVRVVARAMADAKYNLASSTDVNAPALAEAEYKRIMEDYSRNGENSELAQFIRGKNTANWTRGLEKPGSSVTIFGQGIYLEIQRREDMKLNTKGRTPEQTLQGATESEVSALLEKLGYDDSKSVSWP